MRGKVTALCLAAVLGVVAGVVTGMALPRGSHDPLHLGISQVDLDCSPGSSVVMVGWGPPGTGLDRAASNNPGAHYLQPSRSCDTAWHWTRPGGHGVRPDPAYVVYLGPYSTHQACSIRMRASHKGSFVTSLEAGRDSMIPCICYVDVARAPVLRIGMTVGAGESIWIRQLQEMLVEVHELKAITGDYDAATIAAVRAEQAKAFPQQSGIVDHDTWRLLAKSLCQ
jgi:hypothetical protein